MFGLEDKNKKPRAPFEFDLEKELKADPAKATKLSKGAESKAQELKNMLRQGAGSKDFDNYGVLLHGYAALQRVLNRVATKKGK